MHGMQPRIIAHFASEESRSCRFSCAASANIEDPPLTGVPGAVDFWNSLGCGSGAVDATLSIARMIDTIFMPEVVCLPEIGRGGLGFIPVNIHDKHIQDRDILISD